MENIEKKEQSTLDFNLPKPEDLVAIANILSQWNDKDEVEKYITRIQNEIDGQTEYGMNFYTMKENNKLIGIGGLADPLPSIMSYAKTENPGELKILYLDNQARGNNFGKKFLNWLEEKALSDERSELLVRSAEKFRETAFEFYKTCGYEDLGQIENSDQKIMELFRKDLVKNLN